MVLKTISPGCGVRVSLMLLFFSLIVNNIREQKHCVITLGPSTDVQQKLKNLKNFVCSKFLFNFRKFYFVYTTVQMLSNSLLNTNLLNVFP